MFQTTQDDDGTGGLSLTESDMDFDRVFPASSKRRWKRQLNLSESDAYGASYIGSNSTSTFVDHELEYSLRQRRGHWGRRRGRGRGFRTFTM